jgi:hypothetical protein
MTVIEPVSTSDTTTVKAFTADRAQSGVLVAIVLLVGLMAGAASFTHVHDWTLTNSPPGTPDWFGWANAVISELIPTASLIEIGRRRRHSASSVRYPMVLLVAAVGVSLTAQLAVARPSVFGWMVSALPALAFFALSKLVFTATAPPRPTTPVPAPTPATSPAPSPDTTRAKVRPAAAHKNRATPAKKTATATKTPARRTPAEKTTAPAAPELVPAAPEPVAATEPPRIFRRENPLRSFLFWKEKENGDGEATQVIHAGVQGTDRSDGGRGISGDSVDGAGDRRERADLAELGERVPAGACRGGAAADDFRAGPAAGAGKGSSGTEAGA